MNVHDSASVDPRAKIHPTATIWGFATVREHAVIGPHCVVGQWAYIDVGVHLGKNCKIQNGAFIYSPAHIGDGVFIGPGALLANDRNPRAVNPDLSMKGEGDWSREGVIVANGASIGARATCVAPLSVGAWSMIGAGSVVARDVLPFELVGGVPARFLDWVGPAGFRLVPLRGDTTYLKCPKTGSLFRHTSDMTLEEVDSHDSPL